MYMMYYPLATHNIEIHLDTYPDRNSGTMDPYRDSDCQQSQVDRSLGHARTSKNFVEIRS